MRPTNTQSSSSSTVSGIRLSNLLSQLEHPKFVGQLDMYKPQGLLASRSLRQCLLLLQIERKQ